MPKQSIPTASRNWPIDSRNHWPLRIDNSARNSIAYEVKMRNYFNETDMPNSIRTDIDTHYLSLLELFTEANKLGSIKFGYWTKRDGFVVFNQVCYVVLSPTEEEEAILIYMKLKYGSFENTLTEFIKETNKRK